MLPATRPLPQPNQQVSHSDLVLEPYSTPGPALNGTAASPHGAPTSSVAGETVPEPVILLQLRPESHHRPAAQSRRSESPRRAASFTLSHRSWTWMAAQSRRSVRRGTQLVQHDREGPRRTGRWSRRFAGAGDQDPRSCGRWRLGWVESARHGPGRCRRGLRCCLRARLVRRFRLIKLLVSGASVQRLCAGLPSVPWGEAAAGVHRLGLAAAVVPSSGGPAGRA
jgi:hypothetical protein